MCGKQVNQIHHNELNVFLREMWVKVEKKSINKSILNEENTFLLSKIDPKLLSGDWCALVPLVFLLPVVGSVLLPNAHRDHNRPLLSLAVTLCAIFVIDADTLSIAQRSSSLNF